MAGWMQLTKAAVESSKMAKNNQNPGSQGGGPSQQQAQQQQQQAQQAQQQQQAQAQAQVQAQAQQATPQMNQANQGQQFQTQRPTNWPPAIQKHVEEATLYPPPGISMGTQAYETWLTGQKEKYKTILYQHEMHKVSTTKISTMLKSLRDKGQEMPSQMIAEGKKSSEAFAQAKQKLEAFRNEQVKYKANTQQNNMQQQPQGQQQDQNRSAPSSATIPQQPFQLKLPGHQNQPPSTQGQQTGMNPSVEAARNAAANANRNSMSPTQQHTPQMGQAPTSFAPTQQQGSNTMGQQQQHPQHATQPHRPSLSAQQPMNTMPHQQNAQGGNNSGPPQPLSHTQAMAQAQRTYSERQTPQNMPPNSLGQSHGGYSNQGQAQQTPNREHSNTASTAPKISKNLPQHLYNPPPAVQFPAARPTLSGPSNGVGGMMGQPAIAKPPAFQLEGDQASGVLSKKKLDELVRQVTGGGEAMNRETLTPEVEEVGLSITLFHFLMDTNIYLRQCSCSPTNSSTTSSLLPVALPNCASHRRWISRIFSSFLNATMAFVFLGMRRMRFGPSRNMHPHLVGPTR
jgi:transcription initiation factor TFIID subunit 12